MSGTHAYAEEGAYSGSVTGCASSESFTADVADAALSATGSSLSATAGQPSTATVATFTDADPGGAVSDYSATIAWGDGSQAAGTVSPSGGGFTVTGIHTYASAGSYTATVTITDAGGSHTAAQTTVAVSSTAPPPPKHATAAFTLPPGPVTAGHTELFDASASHANGAQVSSFTWIVRGPGVKAGRATVTCDGDTSQLQTSFSEVGVQAVTLRVTDALGAVTSVTHALSVTGRRLRRQTGEHVNQLFLCQRGPSDAAVKATTNGGPPSGCQDQLYYSQLVEALGCFTLVYDLSQIPGPEYNILCPHVSPQPCSLVLGNGGVIAPLLGATGDSSAAGRSSPKAFAATGAPKPPPPVLAIATSEVRINGLDVTPAPGAAIVLDIYGDYLVSSNATVSLLDGKLTVHQGKLDTPTYNSNGDIPVFDTNLGKLASNDPTVQKLVNLGGFLLGGTLTVDLVKHAAKIGASITLPSSFTDLTATA